MTYCTKCGKQNPDTAKFCTSCGAVLSPAVAIHVKQTDSIQKSPVISQKKNKTPWIITGIAIILALGTGAYVLFFNKLKKNETNVSSNTTAGNSSGTNPIEKPSDPDAEKLKDLVGQWDVGMNSRNSNQIGNLYNKELVYYRIQMYRDLVVANLGAFFQKNPGYNQHIIGEITVSRPEGGRMECDFTKQVQQDGKTTDYPSYLKFSKESGDWKIVEEGDKITDYNLGKKQPVIPSSAISGDFDGDGQREYVWPHAPNLNMETESCGNEDCYCQINFSNTNLPRFKLPATIDAFLDNAGDLDGDGRDELIMVPAWFTSCWRTCRVLTFKKGLWKDIVEPFTVHCDLMDAGGKLIRKTPGNPGYAIITYRNMPSSVEEDVPFSLNKSVLLLK